MKGVSITSASLSMVGSLGIVCLFLSFPRLRSIPFTAVFHMCMAGSIVGIGDLLSVFQGVGVLCQGGAFLAQVGDVSVFLWTGSIATMVVLVVRAEWDNAALKKALVPVIAFNWLVPLALGIVPAATQSYGPSGPWCWIVQEETGLRFGCYYALLMASMVYSVGCLVLLLCGGQEDDLTCGGCCSCRCDECGGATDDATKGAAVAGGGAGGSKGVTAASRDRSSFGPGSGRRSAAASEQLRSAAARRLALFCAVFIAIRIWSVINRVNQAADPQGPELRAVQVLQAMLSPAHAFACALVYGLNAPVRALLGVLWRRVRRVMCCGCDECGGRGSGPDGAGVVGGTGRARGDVGDDDDDYDACDECCGGRTGVEGSDSQSCCGALCAALCVCASSAADDAVYDGAGASRAGT